MIETLKCSSCGGDIEQDVPFRQCPKCLLDLALWCQAPPAPEFAPFAFPSQANRGPALPDYETLAPIGRGGMGIVYRARQLSLNRLVALKVIVGGDLASPAALARFRREAEAAAKLDHPNIVPIYEVGEYEANPFLVMRLVEGPNLAEFIASNSRRPHVDSCRLPEAARLMAAVARAVHYAHERGVLHRDLKPSNILLDGSGNPHLTDFGVAKLVDQETALTQTAELLGTPYYMSPEQAAGKPLSVAADIYSLGVILYELLTGRRPFEAERPVEILRKVIEQEPTHPALLNDSVDRELATICLTCLDKDPARRYGSALALAQDLECWQRREPILARPAGAILRLRRWTARNPALATLMAGLIVGMGLTLGLLAKAREQEKRKSIALAILRTETARQLQEIWASPSPFFAIKSETLSAMAGKEPGRLQPDEKRYTIAFLAEGNPLDRVLGAAPLLEYVEQSMTASSGTPVRMDLRLYKQQSRAVADLIAGQFDFMHMNAREYLRAKSQAPGLQPLVSLAAAGGLSRTAVIFTHAETGIKSLPDLAGRSFLFGAEDSTLTFWTKACLVEAGIRASHLSKYRYLAGARDLSKAANSQSGLVEAPDLGNPFSEMTPIAAVLTRSYDAAVAMERLYLQVAAGEKLVLLHQFQDSGSLLAGQSKLPAGVANSFQQAMLKLKNPEILQTLPGNPSGFAVCVENDFAEMRSKLAAESLFDEPRRF